MIIRKANFCEYHIFLYCYINNNNFLTSYFTYMAITYSIKNIITVILWTGPI